MRGVHPAGLAGAQRATRHPSATAACAHQGHWFRLRRGSATVILGVGGCLGEEHWLRPGVLIQGFTLLSDVPRSSGCGL